MSRANPQRILDFRACMENLMWIDRANDRERVNFANEHRYGGVVGAVGHIEAITLKNTHKIHYVN